LAAIESDQAASESGGGLRILLAEDHPVNQKVAARMLEGMGHHVVVVDDGRQAVDALDTSDVAFDVVLMDVQMPVMDGFEAVAALRARTHRPWVPVIALTAHAMKGDRERCIAAGFDDYLAKPIRSADLRDLLKTLVCEARPATTSSGEGSVGPTPSPQVNHSSVFREGEVPVEPSLHPGSAGASPSRKPEHASEKCSHPSDDRPVAFLEGLIERCGGDEEFARELIVSFLESGVQSVSAMFEALEAEDASRLAWEAHGFKGASLTLGAQELADICKRLEAAARRGNLAEARSDSVAFKSAWEQIRRGLSVYIEACV
jgi:CheY-like chemotaxis protein/HPt (histidine-containing phosphotransfer) domain-containing protein